MTATDDPYAWLEDVHGAQAPGLGGGAERQIAGPLKADPRYQKNYDSACCNCWTPPTAFRWAASPTALSIISGRTRPIPRALWRRTTIADYQNPAPHWEILLDVDALAKTDKENWVFKGAECSPGETRCLIRLSRGGGDAVVMREYDLKAKHLATDGFAMAEAKTDASYLDDDTVLFATARDGETTSGYARIVKFWRRGQAGRRGQDPL